MLNRTECRKHFPVCNKWGYLDHAAVAPLPLSTSQVVQDFARQASEEGDAVWPEWLARSERVRELSAGLIGASSAEIAFVANTTAGINLVAQGLDWKQGDNIVLPAGEFPSNFYPWKVLEQFGVELRIVEVDSVGRVSLEQIEAKMDSRTRLLAASWVGFASGFRLDLHLVSELCRRKNVLFFLDAIQGLGVLPINTSELHIDFLAADGHKWMCGLEGCGLFYCRQENLDRLKVTSIGWNSMAHRFDFDRLEVGLPDSAKRFEGGSLNMLGISALGASLSLLQGFGLGPDQSGIGERVLEIRSAFVSLIQNLGGTLLSPIQSDESGGIVRFEIPGIESLEARRRFLEQGLVMSCRSGKLRISPHFYNDGVDLARFEAAWREICRPAHA